jgi:hypothetical protein
MTTRRPPDLDPATLRWVADELTARAKKWAKWSAETVTAALHRRDEWSGGAEAMRTHAKRLRACATRIELKRGTL